MSRAPPNAVLRATLLLGSSGIWASSSASIASECPPQWNCYHLLKAKTKPRSVLSLVCRRNDGSAVVANFLRFCRQKAETTQTLR